MKKNDISILLLLHVLEKTDQDHRVSMGMIRYHLHDYGIWQTEKEVREDISILIKSGKNVKEENREFWMA